MDSSDKVSGWTSAVSTPNRRQRPGGSRGSTASRPNGVRMTEHELLRIITFLERVRQPFQELVPIAEEDATWNLLLFLIKNHLTGTPVAISTLASVAKAPHATAMRRIHALIERGDILQEILGEGSKRYKLRPSEALLESFIQYARRIKFLLAETFGLRSKVDSDEDFYFGGSYFAAQIIPPPRLIESLFRGKQEIQFLLNDDNYFLSMRNMWADFRNNMASRKNFDLRKLPQLHSRLVENAGTAVSEYDIVAINAPWLGEAVKKKLVIPLDEHIKSARLSSLDFHPSVWSMGSWRGQQFGVPIYCTIELLAARIDLFEKDKIEYPTTFEKTVAAAKHFHAPAKGRFGIAWNGARGMPIASTFMFLMGCCGESILHIPKASLGMGVDEAQGEQLRPQIQSEAGMRVLDYLHRLKEFSPPDILEMDWDRRTTSFLSGETALAYCWTVRAARFESDVSSAVKRKVRYLPQPRGPGGASNNPMGGFLLCIPSNLPPERVELAFEAIAWMTSPEAMKANVQNGFPVAPRFSVAADPEAAATSPIVSVVDRLAKRNLLKGWPRPPVPEYLSLEAILGEEIHKALREETTNRQALANAQTRADQVMRDAGYY
jgi:multiple sugar transport system substrate-binding protein